MQLILELLFEELRRRGTPFPMPYPVLAGPSIVCIDAPMTMSAGGHTNFEVDDEGFAIELIVER